jgi:DNA-binding transcriptional MocR family regulator
MRIAALPAPAMLESVFAAAVKQLPRWLDHHGYDPLGLPPLRAAIARRFSERGLPTRAEQILVTSGGLHALDLSIRAILRRGQQVLVEIPSYPAALDALAAAGARVRTVPVGAHGWDLEALAASARTHRPALAYLIPEFQNPTGAVMAQEERRRAVRALDRAGTHTVIDETFAELNLDGVELPAPVAEFDAAGRTITIGSLSKSVWGGLRVGWARAEPDLVRRLATARATLDMASPVLEQIAAVHVFQRLDEIVAERRALLRARRERLATALDRQLPSWNYSLPAGGMHLWAQLPGPISTSLAVGARERGLLITPGPRFGAAGLLERYIRLPFTQPPEQLQEAVAILTSIAPAAPCHGAANASTTFVA